MSSLVKEHAKLTDTFDLKVLNESTTDCSQIKDGSVSEDASKQTNTEESNNDIIASCSHLMRFITALRYYELLPAFKGREKGDTLFADLCVESYPLFLDDYIHFTRHHLGDIEAIKTESQKKFGLIHCAISQCKVQRRDSRRRGGKTCGASKGDCDHFHGDVMANSHFLLHHLIDHGLRTITTALSTTEPKAKKDADDEVQCVDAESAAKAAQIAQSKKMSGADQGASTKFMIKDSIWLIHDL